MKYVNALRKWYNIFVITNENPEVLLLSTHLWTSMFIVVVVSVYFTRFETDMSQ